MWEAESSSSLFLIYLYLLSILDYIRPTAIIIIIQRRLEGQKTEPENYREKKEA